MVHGFKKSNDLWLEGTYFYRNSKLRLMPFLPKFDWNLCRVFDGTQSLDLMSGLIHEGFKILAPHMTHRCPYSGIIGFENLSLPEIYENSFPQVIPVGTYKSIWRFYRKRDNVSYITFFGIAEIKTIDVMQSFSM